MKTGDVQFEVIVGTYEEFVLGFQFSIQKDQNKRELLHTFATHSHRASVRSVACGGKLVVSGGADETINIYNMVTRKECGMLMEHNGTISSLSFTPDCSHLISTSEDGTIKVFRQGSWQMEKAWNNAHKGAAVTCLSVHPSGKLALSVGKDHTLHTWNLVKGRPAYTTNLFSRCRQLELVIWSPGGLLFAIPMDCQLELNSTDKAGVFNTLKLPTKVTACVFLSDEVVCVGEASGEISGHNTETSKKLWSISGNQRIRGLAFLHSYLVAATSSGSVCVYSMEDITTEPQQVARTDTGCRITCLTLFDYKREMEIKKEPSDKKLPNNLNEIASSKFKEKKKTTNQEQSKEKVKGKPKLSSSKTSNNSGDSKIPPEDSTILEDSFQNKENPESKSNKPLFNRQKFHHTNSSSFTELDTTLNTSSSRKKKNSDFREEEHKKTKKQKLSNTNMGSVICSPQAQKWVVEDSKR